MIDTMRHAECYLFANWSAPENICAFTTTRNGGVSEEGYESLNLSLSSGDKVERVMKNRQKVIDDNGWGSEPLWLRQVHGTHVIDAEVCDAVSEADAVVSRQVGLPAMVMTADCLPVLFCNDSGTCVAAAHAGWQGLAAGVLESTVAAMKCLPSELIAWMGPAISQEYFEVGAEVRDAFLEKDAEASQGFIPGKGDRWYADLYMLARQRLDCLGITRVYGGDCCTHAQEKLFFSYRRDGKVSGRMTSAVWIRQFG